MGFPSLRPRVSIKGRLQLLSLTFVSQRVQVLVMDVKVGQTGSETLFDGIWSHILLKTMLL